MIGSMTTLLVSHSDCLYHDTSPGHPESPDRLRAVMRALAAEEFAPLLREEAPSATDAQLLRVHPPEVLRRLAAKVDESAMRRSMRTPSSRPVHTSPPDAPPARYAMR